MTDEAREYLHDKMRGDFAQMIAQLDCDRRVLIGALEDVATELREIADSINTAIDEVKG